MSTGLVWSLKGMDAHEFCRPDCLFVTTDWVIASVEANYPVLEDEFELERLQRRS